MNAFDFPWPVPPRSAGFRGNPLCRARWKAQPRYMRQMAIYEIRQKNTYILKGPSGVRLSAETQRNLSALTKRQDLKQISDSENMGNKRCAFYSAGCPGFIFFYSTLPISCSIYSTM